MKTIVAVYDDIQDARAAIDDLVDAGYSFEAISLLAPNKEGEYVTEVDETAEGAGEGAIAGGILGGLTGALVGLVALAIPGVGPIIAAGPIAAALAGAGIGAVSGGLLGALASAGIPDQETEYYVEAIRRGSAVVTIQVDQHGLERAQGILNRHHAVDIETRAQSWQDEGWTGFDYEGYDSYEPSFRQHYDLEYSAEPYPYSRYEPAYRYGYSLATDERYSDYDDWNELEGVAKREWDEDQGAWDDLKGAVHYAWYRAAEAVREAGDAVGDFFDSDDGYYERYEPRFRSHYDAHFAAKNGYSYSLYDPAYHYGYALATYNRYRDYHNWDELEFNARREWEENFDGPWEVVKDAVRTAWRTISESADDVWDEVTDPLDGQDDY